MTLGSWMISDKATLWIIVNTIFLLIYIYSKEKGKDTLENVWEKTRETVGKAKDVIEDTLKKKPKEE